MNLFSETLTRFFLGEGGVSRREEGNQPDGPLSRVTSSGKTLTDTRALQLSAVFSCIRVITESGANLPLYAYEDLGEGKRRELEHDFPMVYLLKHSPNQYMTPLQFRTAMWFQRTAWGNGYAKIDRVNGRPVALHPFKPGSVEVEVTNGRTQYKHTSDSSVTTYDAEQIFHFMGLTYDGRVGLSPLKYARESMGIAAASDERAATSFGGVPNLVMKTPDWLTTDQRKGLKQIYDRLDDGQHTWVLEGGVTAESLGLSPDDLQMLESRQFQIAEIARFYGVPVVMIDGAASAGASWPASYEKQVNAFRQFTLHAAVESFESTAINSLLTSEQKRQHKYYIEHSYESLLRADTAARTSYLTSMVANGIMTRNEARRMEKLPPSDQDGADDLTVQLNMSKLQDLPDLNEEDTAPEPAFEPAEKSESRVVIELNSNQFEGDSKSKDAPKRTEKHIVEWDEKGFPKKIIEQEIVDGS